MSGYRTPYTPTPGGATPPAEMTPEEGRAELWTFFWFSILGTAIIGVAGTVAYFLIHP
ncbi:MAG: hypothetical protein ACYCPV_00850 [Thermoplasmata archaeon]|jgi:hypothetical protein